MKLKEWCDADKGRRAFLAKELGVSRAFITVILQEKQEIPPLRALKIESVTRGAVNRADCRPNDWKQFWPEFKPQAAARAQEAG